VSADDETIDQATARIIERWRPLLLRMSGGCTCHSGSVCAAACKAGRHHVGCPWEK
jgi:hypothetical protein